MKAHNIITLIDASCTVCGKTVLSGNDAIWMKSGFYHPACAPQSESEKATSTVYIKNAIEIVNALWPAIVDNGHVAANSRFDGYTENSVKGIVLIESMSDEQLKVLLAEVEQGLRQGGKWRENNPLGVLVTDAFGDKTNLRWVQGRIVEEAYRRDLIDVDKHHRLQQDIG